MEQRANTQLYLIRDLNNNLAISTSKTVHNKYMKNHPEVKGNIV